MSCGRLTMSATHNRVSSQDVDWVCMQEQSGPGPHGQAASDRQERPDRASGSSPEAARHQLPHAQKYMLLHALSQQLEAGHVEQVLTQIKEELEPDFLEHHPDLLFELQRYKCCPLRECAASACGLENPLSCCVSCCAVLQWSDKTACLWAVVECAALSLLAWGCQLPC